MFRPVTSLCIALVSLCCCIHAEQVQLDVSLVKSVLPAEQKQFTHLQVMLKGFEMESSTERTPVNVAIVIDRSGSMSGEKIARAREAAIMAIDKLQPDDIASVVSYDDKVNVVVPATKISDKDEIISMIRQIHTGGSTALYAGVQKGAQEVRKFFDKKRVNRVILLSDGLANVGPSSPEQLGKLGSALLEEGISVTTIGIGLGYNEELMIQLARQSHGNRYFAERASDLEEIFQSEFQDVLSVVAQEVAVTIQCAEGIRPVRGLNRDPEIDGQNVYLVLNQLYSKQQKYLLLEVEVPATAHGKVREIATVEVSYANMQTKTTDKLSSTVMIRFSNSLAEVEKSIKKEVFCAVMLQMAVARSKMAVELRDQGQIAKAKKLLLQNAKEMEKYARKYDSKLLTRYAASNRKDAKDIEKKEQWNRQRKAMRDEEEMMEDNQDFDESDF